MTVGPYRPITFLSYVAHIRNFFPHAELSQLLQPSFRLSLALLGDPSSVRTIRVVLADATGRVVKQEDVTNPLTVVNSAQDILHWELSKADTELWWPVGYGNQTLHTVTVSLLAAVSPNHIISPNSLSNVA